MMTNLLRLVVVIMMLTPFLADAQCRSHAKRKCRPDLDPYVHSGQLSTAMVFPGDDAELILTFTSGQSYRVLICSEEILGEVEYKIRDTDRNIIYDSEKDPKAKNYFDFKVAATQQLIVEVNVPAQEEEVTHDISLRGCLSVLTGFKE